MADVIDDDAPELDDAFFERARPMREALPPEAQKAFRGPNKTPAKKPTSIRLSQRVLEHYKSQGAGWQTRLNEDLEALIAIKAGR